MSEHFYPDPKKTVEHLMPPLIPNEAGEGALILPPEELLTNADPQRQLELRSLAARIQASKLEDPSSVYNRADAVTPVRLYSAAVEVATEHLDEPASRSEINKYLRAQWQRPAYWQIEESIQRNWEGKVGKHTDRAQERAKEIIPPTYGKTRRQQLRRQRQELAQLAEQTAWERTQRLKEEQEVAPQRLSYERHEQSIMLAYNIDLPSAEALGVHADELAKEWLGQIHEPHGQDEESRQVTSPN